MTPGFHNPPTVHHVYHVRVHCSRQPVCDDDRCSTYGKFTEPFEPIGFGPGIQRTRRLVENNNRRTAQKRPRERNTLPLTNTQFSSTSEPMTQECLFLLRQMRDDLFSAGRPDRS